MKKIAKKDAARKGIAEVVQLGLREVVRRGLREVIFDEGMQSVLAMLEEERTAVCGPRHKQGPKRRGWRNGHVDGELVLGGRLVSVRRPRVRDAAGEVTLLSWAAFSQRDPLDERAVEQLARRPPRSRRTRASTKACPRHRPGPRPRPARRLAVDEPELDFGDYTADDTDQPAWPSPAARSPPEADHPVDADPPADDDSYWGA